MQIKGIYVVLFLGFIQWAAVFLASPYMTAQNLSEIVKGEDEEAWAQKADRDYLEKYSRVLLDGLLSWRVVDIELPVEKMLEQFTVNMTPDENQA